MSSSTFNLLLLHLAQAESALDKARNNAYSDKLKQEYQDKLSDLFSAISIEVTNNPLMNEGDIFALYKRHIDFIFKSLEFLDSSTLNQIPYEIIECLNYALNNWVDSNDKYIIVTSLINDISGFSFDPSLAYNDALYNEIKARYKIEFPHRLVQINLPRTLSRDYLSSVVLYHELGHFIDLKFKFTESLTRVVLDKLTSGIIVGNELSELLIFFPFLKDVAAKKTRVDSRKLIFAVTNSHFAEYFCDLFASQYISESSNYYLKYITENSTNYSQSHPSTINRINTVNDYLSGADNIVIRLINEAISKILKSHKLEIRFEELKENDICILLPIIIYNERQLHGIFKAGWDVWLYKQDEIAKNLNDQYPNPSRLYSVINNLIEKSIGNFITANKWTNAKS